MRGAYEGTSGSHLRTSTGDHSLGVDSESCTRAVIKVAPDSMPGPYETPLENWFPERPARRSM